MWFCDQGRPDSCLEASFVGQVNFYGAKISGDLNCSGGDFRAPGSYALNCAALQVGGSVFLTRFVNRAIDGRVIVIELSDAFRATGMVSLQGATIGLHLNCTGGRFENTDDLALDVSNARIKGSAIFGCWFLDAENVAFRFTSHGAVYLFSTEIGGNLECAGGQFANKGNVALAGGGAQIGGDANLCQATGQNGRFGPRFSALGEVNLIASKIGRYLQCPGGSFVHPDGLAMSCSAIEVGGVVFLSKSVPPDKASAGFATSSQGVVAPAPFESAGVVDFKYAQISAVLLCQGGRFRNSAPDKTTPSQAALALDLRSGRMDTLQTRHRSAWKHASPDRRLDRFVGRACDPAD